MNIEIFFAAVSHTLYFSLFGAGSEQVAGEVGFSANRQGGGISKEEGVGRMRAGAGKVSAGRVFKYFVLGPNLQPSFRDVEYIVDICRDSSSEKTVCNDLFPFWIVRNEFVETLVAH